jgi:uncharacterized membrane protein (DUF4010 family)
MSSLADLAPPLATALGIGLLIGAERERIREESQGHYSAGIRTFAITSLLGAVSLTLGGVPLLAAATIAIAAYSALAYHATSARDPGLTTEVSLLLTLLLGALAMREAPAASALGVLLAVLLALRGPLHRFVREALTADELRDGLLFAAAVLVVLPLMPNAPTGPYGAINPRRIWTIVILVMSIGAAGYAAVRLLGPRYGLPLAGFASGFVSSSATIAAMAARSRAEPALLRPAAAGAVLSSVATIVQMVLLLAAISPPLLREMALPLAASGAVALLYGAWFTARSAQTRESANTASGHPFSLKAAIAFGLLMALVLLAPASLHAWMGRAGVLLAAALAGFADTHSAAASAASLAASGNIPVSEAVLPVLAALSTNAATKALLALHGGRAYAAQILPGLLAMTAAAWLTHALA